MEVLKSVSFTRRINILKVCTEGPTRVSDVRSERVKIKGFHLIVTLMYFRWKLNFMSTASSA